MTGHTRKSEKMKHSFLFLISIGTTSVMNQGWAPGRVFSGFCDPARKPGFRAGFRVENFKFRVPGRACFWLRVPGTRTKTRNFFEIFFEKFSGPGSGF